MDVSFKEGVNTITIYNDNSYKFSEVVDDYAPQFDRFDIIPVEKQLRSDKIKEADITIVVEQAPADNEAIRISVIQASKTLIERPGVIKRR